MLRPFLFYGEDESDGAELGLFCGAGGGCGGCEGDREIADGRLKFVAGSGDGTGGITCGGGDGLDGRAGSGVGNGDRGIAGGEGAAGWLQERSGCGCGAWRGGGGIDLALRSAAARGSAAGYAGSEDGGEEGGCE
jgi:hypothetical protein